MTGSMMRMRQRFAFAAIGTGVLGLAVALTPTTAVAADPSWMEKALLAKAKKEGGKLVVYGSMNEKEALPLWAIFDKITGITTTYVRASDTKLMGRIIVENRAKKYSWDLLQTTALEKMPKKWLSQIDPPLGKDIPKIAKDPDRRWYGVYANYNAPAYNPKHVKKADLPKTYEDFLKHKEWKGRIAIDGRDNEWLKGVYAHLGAKKGEKLMRDLQSQLDVKIVRGHGGLARSTSSGEHMVSLNNYVNLTVRTMLKGGDIDYWFVDPVVVFYGQIGKSANSPNPSAALLGANYILSKEAQTQLAKSGRIPTRTDVKPKPANILKQIGKHKVISAILSPKEEKEWQTKFSKIFGRLKKRRKKKK